MTPAITLRMDLTGTAFGAAPTWTDYSPSLLTAGDGTPISLTFGRQDEQSDPQPAQCSFVLDNTSGQWTPGNGAASSGWDVGTPVNIRETVGGTTYDRFTGYVDSIEPAFPGASWSLVQVSCTDITARLGSSAPLRTIVLQEMLEAGPPTYLYPLNEPSGSTGAGDIMGAGPAATLRSAYVGPGEVSFGTDMGLLDGATGAHVTATVPGDGADLATVLSISGAFVQPTGAFTILITVVMPTMLATGGNGIFEQTDGGANKVGLRIVPGPPIMQFDVDSGTGGNVRVYGPVLADGGLHQFALTLGADRKTSRLYADGVQQGSAVAATAHTLTGMKYHVLGGNLNPITLAPEMPLQGSIAQYAIYPMELSAAEILTIYRMTAGSFTERSDQRYARIAGYTGLATTGLPTGQAIVGAQLLNGKTVLDALAETARVEGTVSYATSTGALTFQGRPSRYHAPVTAALTSADVAPDLTVRRDRQGMVNQLTASRPNAAGQTVVDTASQTAYGRFDGGSLEVPVATDDDALQAATWRVQTRKNPLTRLPNLRVDLLSQPTTAIVQAVLSCTIGSKVTITGLPSQAPSSSMTVFVEGWTETLGVEDWSISFFTSPITLEDQTLVLDDATFGQLGTYRLGF